MCSVEVLLWLTRLTRREGAPSLLVAPPNATAQSRTVLRTHNGRKGVHPTRAQGAANAAPPLNRADATLRAGLSGLRRGLKAEARPGMC